MKTYLVGIDFGTLSARGVLADASDGRVAASAVCEYAHGVMEKALPDGTHLPSEYVLQHPADYLDALRTVTSVLAKRAADGEIAGLGIDFTCTTSLPLDSALRPLCETEKYEKTPDAYAKLWRHAAAAQGRFVTETASAHGLAWLRNVGGEVCGEWAVPKLLELKQNAPALFDETEYYMEAGDWLVSLLCGEPVRSLSYAGYKNFYREGFPDETFFAAVDPAFEHIMQRQFRGKTVAVGEKAGLLSPAAAEKLGLPAGIAITAGLTDAHQGAVGAGAYRDGDLLCALGTSACFILQSETDLPVTGISSQMRGGIFENLTSYESTSSMGDMLAWFLDELCPAKYFDEAKKRNMNIHALLTEKAAALGADHPAFFIPWLGGSRCLLRNSDLSGSFHGLRFGTDAPALYRAILEGIAFESREIFDNYTSQGLTVGRVIAAGGISKKNALMMQILADVLGREIEICASDEAAALGSAITAAAAADVYADITAACAHMAAGTERTFRPDGDRESYEKKFREYHRIRSSDIAQYNTPTNPNFPLASCKDICYT